MMPPHQVRQTFRAAMLAFFAIIVLGALPALAQDAPKPGIEELGRLDALPRLRTSNKVASFSSYDRTGGNDDGFSGKYSFIRKEGDALVIADLKGPGVIYRIWTPTPTDDPVEFYFDGETTPRIKVKFREIFDGEHAPFAGPLAAFGAGGFYSYVPLPFEKSCKVLFRGPQLQFYQINYATYTSDTKIETYSTATANTPALETARGLFSAAGTDISAAVAGQGARTQRKATVQRLAPGKSVTLLDTKKGGRVVGIRISPASALAGKDRSLVLRATWDGDKAPAINSPAGDFFGYSWGQAAARSLMVGSTTDTAYCYFPMPYDRSARIELVNERTGGEAVEIRAEVLTTDTPRRADEGRFYGVWRRESPTTKGKPFTFVETTGRGHVVGVTLQAQGSVPGITPFFEGDDQATIDGELVIHGTGSEDFFNGGWYDVPGRWETRISFPLSGCLDYKRPMARSGAYRLFLTDAYAFKKSIHLAIEHAPERNDFDADYVGVTYLYSQDPPTYDRSIPTQAARVVADPARLVYTPGWYLPMHSFSMERATINKRTEQINGREERILSMKTEGQDVFGQHHLSLLCDVPAGGKYRVSVEVIEGPGQGLLQLFHQEKAVGPVVDMYSPVRNKSKVIPLGELNMAEGPNQVFMKLVGQNAKATGQGLDLVTVILEAVR